LHKGLPEIPQHPGAKAFAMQGFQMLASFAVATTRNLLDWAFSVNEGPSLGRMNETRTVEIKNKGLGVMEA